MFFKGDQHDQHGFIDALDSLSWLDDLEELLIQEPDDQRRPNQTNTGLLGLTNHLSSTGQLGGTVIPVDQALHYNRKRKREDELVNILTPSHSTQKEVNCFSAYTSHTVDPLTWGDHFMETVNQDEPVQSCSKKRKHEETSTMPVFNDLAELFDALLTAQNAETDTHDTFSDNLLTYAAHSDAANSSDNKQIPSKRKREKDPQITVDKLVNAEGAGKSKNKSSSTTKKKKKKQGLNAFEITKKGETAFAKDKAVQKTYKVKLNEQWNGNKLIDIESDFKNMIAEVLKISKGSAKDTDLGNIYIHNNKMIKDIPITLRPWGEIDEDVVLDQVRKVLQSHKDLTIDPGFEITVGSIEIPSGTGQFTQGYRLAGANSAVRLKNKAFYEVCNQDNACMYLAVTAAWVASLPMLTYHEWHQACQRHSLEGQPLFKKLLVTRSIPRRLKYKHLLQKMSVKALKPLAMDLCELSGLDYNSEGTFRSIAPMEVVLDVNIHVMDANLGNKVSRVGHGYDRSLYIYSVTTHTDGAKYNHYHAIKDVQAVFNRCTFCTECMQPHKVTSKCPLRCLLCKKTGCKPVEGHVKVCRDCNIKFNNQDCFQYHLKVENGRSGCSTYFKCPTCDIVVARQNKDRSLHQCYTSRCEQCNKMVTTDHLCYNRNADPEDTSKFKYIFFDFEARQDKQFSCAQGYRSMNHDLDCAVCSSFTSLCINCRRCSNCNDNKCGASEHIVNYVNIQTVCEKCVHDPSPISTSVCANCGSLCTQCLEGHTADCSDNKCGQREIIFAGDDTIVKFCNWVFTKQHQGAKAFSHNGKGYDNHFIMPHMLEAGEVMTAIYNGSKIISMSKDKITFVDSSNFFMMPLAALPKAFGLKEDTSKLAFPHFFNTVDHQDYVGPYPDPEDYGASDFSETKKEEFMAWHASKQNCIFDFKAEMEIYCRMDTSILREAMMKFRESFFDLCDIDPFKAVTMASLCMKVFRQNFLTETWTGKLYGAPVEAVKLKGKFYLKDDLKKDITDQLQQRTFVSSPVASIPKNGYVTRLLYSKESLQWLKYRELTDNVKIMHAGNGRGEVRIRGTNYFADGFAHTSGLGTVYNFEGCIVHSCVKCFPYDRNKLKNPLTGKTLEKAHHETVVRNQKLAALGYNLVNIWACQFEILVNSDPPGLADIIEEYDHLGRLDVRQAFHGGRVNAIKLHCKARTGERISYTDVTSLYPAVQKYSEYGLGHPEIITENFKPIHEYFGIAKITIDPPADLYHPVLPLKCRGKLMFPLCRTCAVKELPPPCKCSLKARVLHGVWCTPEILKAVEKGYKIIKVYEVYHFSETTKYDRESGSGGLFADYINTFLKLKQESSNWPKECKTEAAKKKYLVEYEKHERIRLDPEAIQPNPALRTIAKSLLTNLWGQCVFTFFF